MVGLMVTHKQIWWEKESLKQQVLALHIFCNKVAFDAQLMNFFYLKKNQRFILEISRFFCFWEIHRYYKICDITTDIAT